MRTGQQIVIDPIDGTKNFVEGRGEFCIAAALTHSVGDGIWPVAGVVALPVKGIMWWTDGSSVRREVIASGAVEEIGRRSVPEKRISVSSKNRAWLAENAFEMKLPWISSGSSVHDFMGTATGELCGSMVGKQRLWDLMAPLAIALRLGSELRDLVTGQVVTCINPSDLSRDLRKRPWGIERKMVLAPRETKLDELIAPR
jgi:3'(2'), 5'-bisphosphate nucleotidase